MLLVALGIRIVEALGMTTWVIVGLRAWRPAKVHPGEINSEICTRLPNDDLDILVPSCD